MKISNRHFLNLVLLAVAVAASHQPKPIEIPQRPLIYIHGINGGCTDQFYLDRLARHNGTCLETGPHLRSLQPYHQMALTGCRGLKEMVRENPDAFANGIYVAAYSNGGLITRHLLLLCPLFRKLLRRVMIHSTPHLGTYSLRMPFKNQLRAVWKVKRFALHYAYSTVMGIHTSTVDNLDNIDDKENHRYIKILAAQETERRSFDLPHLELWVNIASTRDMVIPYESSLFGANYFLENNTLVAFNSTEAYRNRYLGLHRLYNEGRYMNCVVEGDHANYDRPDQEQALFNLLKDNCSFDPAIFGSARQADLYPLCLKMKIAHSNSLRKLTCDPTPSQLYHAHGMKREIRGFTMTVWRPNAV